MTLRLTASFFIAAVRRRVEAAGGFATILHHGDDDAGAILIQCCYCGDVGPLLERGAGGMWTVIRPIQQVPAQSVDSPTDSVAMDYTIVDGTDTAPWSGYIARRLEVDPDLWIIELDVADAQQMIADM